MRHIAACVLNNMCAEEHPVYNYTHVRMFQCTTTSILQPVSQAVAPKCSKGVALACLYSAQGWVDNPVMNAHLRVFSEKTHSPSVCSDAFIYQDMMYICIYRHIYIYIYI